jgi:hypothetical protein
MQTDGSKLEVYAQTVTVYSVVGAVRVNTWYHFALERNGANFEFYLNGARVNQVAAVTLSSSSSNVLIGADATYQLWSGYIADFRIVKGSAVYSGATYTVPTAPLTAITNTQLLLNTTNGAIFDGAMMNDLETVGNAQISTSVVKFGTGSLAFDGAGDYLKINKNIPQGVFAGDFTIEFWFNVDGVVEYRRMFNNAPGTTPGGYFYIYYRGTEIRMYNADIAGLLAVGTFTANTWTFLAISRSGSTTRVFVNGAQTYSYSGSSFFLSDDFYIGGGPDMEYTNGYIDDFRITKGYARYGPLTASPSNTTASSLRVGSTVADFFSAYVTYGIFGTYTAGQYLLVDFGSSVTNMTTTYRNAVGGQWAPTQVLIQTSDNNSTWTTVSTYADDASTLLQTISSVGSGRYWRLYQNTNTRENTAGYDWHMDNFSMTAGSYTVPSLTFAGFGPT